MAYPIHFKHPFSMVVAGPSFSGKTQFVRSLLLSNKVKPSFERIIWAYAEWQPAYDVLTHEFPNRLEFQEGWSADLYKTLNRSENNCLVIDDLMSSASKDSSLSDLFTKGAHQRNTTVILIVQNLFFQGKSAVDVRRNAGYIVLFNSKQDALQIERFGRQVFPRSTEYFVKSYKDATAVPHGYLLIDLTTNCPTQYMLRGNVLSDRPAFYLNHGNQ